MQLHRVRVINFKSILDSNWFTVDDLTCLVGKNESGKTAILEALEKLNSTDASRANFRLTEYPRMNWSEYEESGEVATALETEWQLDNEEIEFINKSTPEPVLKSPVIKITKNYNNKLDWDISLDYDKAVTSLLNKSGLEEEDRKALGTPQNTDALFKALRDLGEETSARHQTFLAELENRFSEGNLLRHIIAYLEKRLPKFVYYSQYDVLPGRVSIDQLINAQTYGNLNQIDGSKIFIALLSMVGTTPQKLLEINRSEELISKLEAVQSRISKRIFKYWSQNKHLKVRFFYGEASPGDVTPFNLGKVFQTRIENTRHEATINLSERSTGFVWFFSFLVWFSEVQREYGDNLIVLLDEAGLSLHGKAQYDLLRFIREELVPKYQVIYTTHSPFMIEAYNLLSCRTVENVVTKDDEILGTKVGDNVLSTDSDTLFPLQAALGYDITQNMFIGEHCLLVEGPSDLHYLQWASSQLTARGHKGLDKRWTITPCGGIAKVFSFMSLFGGNKLHVAVLTDYGKGDKKKVEELRESDLLRKGHVLTAQEYSNNAKEADIEDVLGRDFYVNLVNHTYELTGKHRIPAERPAEGSERVTEEVKQHFMRLPPTVPEYDHYAPAKYLLEHPEQIPTSKVDAALEHFAKLFVDINALLP
ncbi:hypothetical protein KDA_46780 [Dictyobacter alpinus]|uniref:Endonuclease GajA/Old nuclease/RecF-like AAA domain-containing protein n=1 Tax=Dictyobacter alpinus TaxID=2014873 RepID=A0A402BCY9_9CHLR|nr:AAA family ATPase [Dictyobacter alpinus]GCE29194.1 hypothetical protein KDA_46780 [Dictyobacter alpinus]